MGVSGWELASIIQTPLLVQSGFTTYTMKLLFIFQRRLRPTAMSSNARGSADSMPKYGGWGGGWGGGNGGDGGGGASASGGGMAGTGMSDGFRRGNAAKGGGTGSMGQSSGRFYGNSTAATGMPTIDGLTTSNGHVTCRSLPSERRATEDGGNIRSQDLPPPYNDFHRNSDASVRNVTIPTTTTSTTLPTRAGDTASQWWPRDDDDLRIIGFTNRKCIRRSDNQIGARYVCSSFPVDADDLRRSSDDNTDDDDDDEEEDDYAANTRSTNGDPSTGSSSTDNGCSDRRDLTSSLGAALFRPLVIPST